MAALPRGAEIAARAVPPPPPPPGRAPRADQSASGQGPPFRASDWPGRRTCSEPTGQGPARRLPPAPADSAPRRGRVDSGVQSRQAEFMQCRF